jgi:hypothetical protein
MKRNKQATATVLQYHHTVPYTKEQAESVDIIIDTLEECLAEIEQLMGSISIRTKREGSIYAAKLAIESAVQYLSKKEYKTCG